MIDHDTKLDYSKCGPPSPLNAAAIAEQERHVAAIDPLLKACDQADIEYRRARDMCIEADRALRIEKERWGGGMRLAMPELADVDEFWISEDGKHYHLPPPAEPERATTSPPAWVQQIIASGEG